MTDEPTLRDWATAVLTIKRGFKFMFRDDPAFTDSDAEMLTKLCASPYFYWKKDMDTRTRMALETKEMEAVFAKPRKQAATITDTGGEERVSHPPTNAPPVSPPTREAKAGPGQRGVGFADPRLGANREVACATLIPHVAHPWVVIIQNTGSPARCPGVPPPTSSAAPNAQTGTKDPATQSPAAQAASPARAVEGDGGAAVGGRTTGSVFGGLRPPGDVKFAPEMSGQFEHKDMPQTIYWANRLWDRLHHAPHRAENLQKAVELLATWGLEDKSILRPNGVNEPKMAPDDFLAWVMALEYHGFIQVAKEVDLATAAGKIKRREWEWYQKRPRGRSS